jgi:hypothetical protein
MSKTYGPNLKFVAFEVRIGDSWLSVPQAYDVCTGLGLEFVDYVLIPTTLEAIDAERDKLSTQAARNGMGEQLREGVVLRPPFEVRLNNGERVMAKHKRAEFSETKTERKVDVEKQALLTEASKIADEWVVANRLQHVIGQLISSRDNKEVDISDTGKIISLMVEDVMREAAGEIIDDKNVRKAIGAKAAKMFKQHLQDRLHQSAGG